MIKFDCKYKVVLIVRWSVCKNTDAMFYILYFSKAIPFCRLEDRDEKEF